MLFRSLVLTVDAPRLGRRERDLRNGFVLPPSVSVRNLETSAIASRAVARWDGGSSFFRYAHDLFDPSVSWSDLAWLRSLSSLPIILKGILTREDAERGLAEGVDGFIVSNHGGRQLDGAMATIDALPEIADYVADRVPVLMDGGIRRGADVLKALACGARAVLIGRPYLYGLAVDGAAGVTRVVNILRREFEMAMAISGRPTIASLDASVIWR